MQEKLGLALSYITGTIILILAIYVIDWGFLKFEISHYPVLCSVELESGDCKGEKTPLNRSIYRVSRWRQDVTYWYPGTNFPIERLTDCAIKNRKNWSCQFDDKSGRIGFSGGNFYTTIASNGIYSVSHIEYLKIQFGLNSRSSGKQEDPFSEFDFSEIDASDIDISDF